MNQSTISSFLQISFQILLISIWKTSCVLTFISRGSILYHNTIQFNKTVHFYSGKVQDCNDRGAINKIWATVTSVPHSTYPLFAICYPLLSVCSVKSLFFQKVANKISTFKKRRKRKESRAQGQMRLPFKRCAKNSAKVRTKQEVVQKLTGSERSSVWPWGQGANVKKNKDEWLRDTTVQAHTEKQHTTTKAATEQEASIWI